jgi:ParB family chromosome partitioning protein
MPVPCRIVPEAEAANVTLSFSENALQLPMDAIDRFEAFAAMRTKDGADVATIARTFAITERAVKEALRLGNIHPEIRKAHRDGVIDLEAMKAFECHPDAGVQLAAFETLTKGKTWGRLQAWEVRGFFKDRAMVRAGDALGALVFEDYRAAGGAITADLIEEDSILEDATLIDTILRRILSDRAEERRAALGLAWGDILVRPSWDELRAFGRVHVQPRDQLSPEDQAKVDAIAAQLEEEQRRYDEAESEEAQQAAQEAHDQLSDALEALTFGYTEFDASISGVIAAWTGSRVEFHEGMVRAELMPDDKAGPSAGGGAGQGTGAKPTAGWSEALRTDMALVRTRSIALALAQSPDLARDYAEFALIRPVLGSRYSSYENGTTIRAEAAAPKFPVKESEGSLKAISDTIAEVHAGLDTAWARQPDAAAFAMFRSLDRAMRDQLLAAAVAETLIPKLPAALRDPVRRTVEAEALPRLRDVWMPDETFLARLTKPALITILTDDLAMPDQAAVLASAKKSEVVTFLTGLFAAPFATLTDDQRQRIIDWCPAELVTPEAPAVDQVPEEEEDCVDDEGGEGDVDEDEEAEPAVQVGDEVDAQEAA